MNEDAVREIVREVLARRAGMPPTGMPAPAPVRLPTHMSHGRYPLPESDGPCVIEPSVACNHCGYCQSHGH